MTDFVIRSLNLRDRTTAFKLICSDLLDESDPAGPSDKQAAADFADLTGGLNRHLAGDASTYFAVATVHETIIGVIASAASFMARPGVWELGWQVVRADCRRRGIGTALLRHGEAYARSHAAEIMLLSTGAPQHHQGAGYRIVVQGANETVMAKVLR